MPFDKLYVKIKCTMCDGTKLFKHSGYHNPNMPYKWKRCPYCDHGGLQLIEAHENSVLEYLLQLDDIVWERFLRARHKRD